MRSFLLLTFSFLPLALSPAAPTREAFALEDRPVESVPLDAFDLADEDLQMEVWAQSPMIYSPVAMDCDAQGRLWLTEGIDYNLGPRVANGQSIIVLADSDHDGKADSSHVFVTEKGLRPAPLGIAIFDNRIVLSATPSMIVYTDVDRDTVFDPKVDTREVFLTGFQNNRHDHTLHAVVGAPSGQWHFSYGNCGADLKTKDGRHFLSGCYYGYPEAIGKPSSDGHTYVGGATMRINPDGTGLAVTGHNMRNPHDMFVTAFGDVLQSDNDDPAHCRSSWVMEYGNMGYSDLRDGSRSWEEVAKTWEEPAGWSRDLRFSRSHWRENYPGACPPGTIYGAGSPTGNLYIEDDTLGLAGTYLVCCMVRKEVMACRPSMNGAAIDMGRHDPFISLKPDQKGQRFLPTDVVLGTDGSLFLADFYNDTSRRTNQVSGTIYRITRKNAPAPPKPEIDFTTTTGQLAALPNPAVNVRSHAAALLVAGGEASLAPTLASLAAAGEDSTRIARHLWVLAQLGTSGREQVAPFLDHTDPQLQIAAYRALRHADPEGVLARARQLDESPSLAVRREVALSLRDTAYADCADILANLFTAYDGHDRYYLEALGTAATGKEAEAYRDLVAAVFGDPVTWKRIPRNLAWRLYTPEAIAALDTYLRANTPPVDDFRHLAMAFASFRNDTDRADRKARLLALAQLPALAAEHYQVTVREIVEKDLNDLQALPLREDSRIPETFGDPTQVSSVESIAALTGDAAQGKIQSSRCTICHKIAGEGVAFGPELTHWGKERTIQEIVTEIVDPDTKLAHGYDTPVRLSGNGHVAEGFLSNYSWHAGSLKIKLLGGTTLKVPFRRTGTRVENLTTSWMPSASEMGLTDQNVRDVAEFLKTMPAPAVTIAAPPETAPGDTTAPGWTALDGDDFLNVSCHDDTWRWEGGHAFCTGKPTGVIRYHEPLVNFEFTCEWMHKQHGGNSGVIVWSTPDSIARLTGRSGGLPQGIEVQVLDLGYAEVYTKAYKKPADWFTSHGDVFPIGPIKFNPFPPVAPNGRRSFPSKETTKGINNWNHYYIRAIDGEVRLWVNGEEVSGGDGISPAFGYLCLESEGAPIEYKNLRLRKLPSADQPDLASLIIPKPKPPITLEGHPLLGTWHYLDTYTREIAADGFCTLRNGEEVIWRRRCTAQTPDSLTFEGDLTHVLKGDTLHIEGRYQASRDNPSSPNRRP